MCAGNEKGQLQAAGVSTPIKAFTEMIVFNNNEIGLYNYGVYSPAKILQRPVLDGMFAYDVNNLIFFISP